MHAGFLTSGPGLSVKYVSVRYLDRTQGARVKRHVGEIEHFQAAFTGAKGLGHVTSRDKMQGKLRAAHHPVLDLNFRIVQFGYALHDRQAQP